MRKPKSLLLIQLALPAAIVLTAPPSRSEPSGIACRTSPGASAPPGMHWYYRVDRANARHCWFLNSQALHVHWRANVASPHSLQRGSSAAQAEATPNDTVRATSDSANAQTPSAEASSPKPPVHTHGPIDFAARWLQLPDSVDLDALNFARQSNSYAARHESTIAQPAPSSIFRVEDGDPRQSSAIEPSFGSIVAASLLGILLLLLCWKAFRLALVLHDEAKLRRARDHAIALSAAADTGLGEITRALRCADAMPYKPQSFAPSGDRATKSPSNRRSSQSSYPQRPARSALDAAWRRRAMV